ncbi:MAG TPA: hypothetical protein PKN04_14340, partial [bacterium]|nr:hypothetical protein [bacterium]
KSPERKPSDKDDDMKKLLIACIVLTATVNSLAQTEETPAKWSLATSLTYPLADIYLLQINYRPAAGHELFFGPCWQNFEHDSFEVNALTLLLGYRRFIYKGLHLEAELYPAYNKIHSKVNDKDYPGIEMWGEFKIGYRFDLAGGRLYIQPAPGIGFGFFRTNKPPNFDEEIDYPTFTPQLLVGIRL